MSDCILCGRPMADQAYADSACAAQAAEKLRAIADLAPEARQVAYGLTRGSQGGASGKPGSRSPGNDDALDALSEVQNTLTTWARHVSEERGVPWRYDDESDPIVDATQWLDEHVEWMRHRPEVDEAFRDFAEAASKLRFIVDGPAARKYLGPCGAATWMSERYLVGDWQGPDHLGPPCEGDVYGRAGAKTGTCRTCGATVDQAERRAWLDDQVRDKAFRAAHIADAYGLNVKTIRSWAERGHLLEHGRDREDRPLYLVGEVLDLARTAAIRRAENEAKRERRADERLSV